MNDQDELDDDQVIPHSNVFTRESHENVYEPFNFLRNLQRDIQGSDDTRLEIAESLNAMSESPLFLHATAPLVPVRPSPPALLRPVILPPIPDTRESRHFPSSHPPIPPVPSPPVPVSSVPVPTVPVSTEREDGPAANRSNFSRCNIS